MALETLLIDLGVRADLSFISRIRTSLASVNKSALLAAGAIGAIGAGVVKAFAVTGEIANTADEIGKTAKQIGISTDALQELRFAADLSGVANEQFSLGLQNLQKQVFNASKGSKEATEIFDRLGVSFTDSDGNLKSAEDTFMDVVAGMQSISSETEKSALAQTLFGRAGKKIGPLLQEGTAGIEAMRKQAQELGGVLGADLIKDSEAFKDQQTRLNFAFQGLKIKIAQVVLPVMEKLVTAFLDLTKLMTGNSKTARLLRASFLALGVLISAALLGKLALAAAGFFTMMKAGILAGKGIFLAGVKAILPWLPLIIIFGLLALVIDDLITYFQGGESIIGDFAEAFSDWLMESDSLLAKFLRLVVGFFQAIVSGIGTAIGWLGDFVGFLASIPGRIIRAVAGAGDAIGQIASNLLSAFTSTIDAIQGKIGELITSLTDAIGLTSVADDEAEVKKRADAISARQSQAAAANRQRNQARERALQQLASEGLGTFVPSAGGGAAGLQLRQGVDQGAVNRRLEQMINTEINVQVDASNAKDPAAVGRAVGDTLKNAFNLRQTANSYATEGA